MLVRHFRHSHQTQQASSLPDLRDTFPSLLLTSAWSTLASLESKEGAGTHEIMPPKVEWQ